MAEGERDQHGEDPFEDLDRFFEPIQGVRWPEDERIETAVPSTEQASTPVVVEQPAPIADMPATLRVPEASEVIVLEPEPETQTVRAGAFEPTRDDANATAELSRDEWRRLRDVLGEEEEEVRFEFPPASVVEPEGPTFDLERDLVAAIPERRMAGVSHAPEVSASAGSGSEPSGAEPVRPSTGGSAGQRDAGGSGDFTSTWPDPETEDEVEAPGDLTLEDLKKAPPEYRDLPGPRREQPVPAEPAPRSPRSTSAAAGAGEMVPGDPHVQVIGGRSAESPSLAEVEAMADRLAREFRETGSEAPAGAPERWAPGEDEDAFGSGARSAAAAGGAIDPYGDDLMDFEPPEPASSPVTPARRTIKVGEPEDLTGPAWEDPTARTVTREAPPPAGRGERNLPIAVFTAAILVVAALASIWIKPVAFAVVAAIVILIAQAEFYAAQQRHEHHPATVLGLVIGAMLVAGAYFRQEPGLLALLALGTGATYLWFIATPVRARGEMIANAASTLFGILYVPFLAGYALVILSAWHSRALELSILGLTFLYDVSAFFIGRYWGRRPLAPTISPKKSWEGLIGATFVTLLASALLPFHMGPVDSIGKAIGLGAIVVVFAPLGDLAESLLKRDMGIKDMGSILPGHGGMLDRVDSLLFVLPAAFYFLRMIS